MMKRNIVQNIGYCLKCTVQCRGSLLCWCGILIATGVVLPILSTYLPKLVIEKMTAGSSLQELIMVILEIMGSIAILSGVEKFFSKFLYRQKFQMNTFYLKKVALKGLTTDYRNQENGEFRRLQVESFACCNGNYSPLCGIYDTLVKLVTGVFGLSIYWTILAKLELVVILFLVVTTVISFFLNQKVVAWTQNNQQERMRYEQRLDYINSASSDIRAGKDLRLYHMTAWFSDIYQENMAGIVAWYRRLTSKLFGVSVCDSGFSMIREGVTYVYLIWLVWNQQISVADFVLYVGAVTGFSTWLGSILSQVTSLSHTNVKINDFRAYLEYPESYKRDGGLPIPADALPKKIELRNVSYRYAESEPNILQDINLTIESGEHLAIVGLNGAGKTTLVKLICGLIEPTKGQVLYDGIDVREYDRVAFYKLFSAVFQQFSIMPVTIEEIVAEKPTEQVDTERVRECLMLAGLWEKISNLPSGTKSQFGKTIYDDGIELSGGEVQKLLLARTLYKASPIMLLDEPTAALDPIAESHLYENYSAMSKGKTTVFISHRLASTSFCHRILLLENGKIREEGTHAGLMRQKGVYAKLFEMQAKYYREKGDVTA